MPPLIDKPVPKYPLAPARYGAIIKVEQRSDGVLFEVFLRAGIALRARKGDQEVLLSSKAEVFMKVKEMYPEMSNDEIHMWIQDQMMAPGMESLVRQMSSRSPEKVFSTTLKLPQFEGKSIGEVKELLIKMLRSGTFDPILTKKKIALDFEELGARLGAFVETGEVAFYPEREKGKIGDTVEEFLESNPMILRTQSLKFAGGTSWWYINEDDMMIEGPFGNLDSTIESQNNKQFQSKELVMANEIIKKLVALADAVDAKGESELAAQIDNLVVEAGNFSSMIKDFHPKGGFTTQLDKPVKNDGAKTETIEEQHNIDLQVAEKKPTGEQSKITACGHCGLTHFSSNVCPSCKTVVA